MNFIHIYCGSGKGKTTAAVGLAIRAAGSGMNVRFVQFMKGGYSSEISILQSVPGITVRRCNKNYGFFSGMTENQKAEITECHNILIKDAFSSGADMIILDEFFCAYNYSLLDIPLADDLILNKNLNAEIILTGRNPDDKFIRVAGYVSEISCIKHPYSKSIKARAGIEY